MHNNEPSPPASTTEAAVLAHGLVVRRGTREVLHGLDFAVPRGEVTGLLGPSGCGKSTLMRAIVGVQAHVTGTLNVLGKPAGNPALRAQIGYVTQSPSVFDDLTITENLNYFARILGADSAAVDRAIAAVSLEAHHDDVVRNLSGGQHSRVSLAVALLGSPQLLVLDEPTVGLDPVLRKQLWDLFHRLADEGTTVLVSSHVMDEASRCDRLLLMRDGALIADGTPATILEATHTSDIESAFLELVQ